MSVDRVRLLEAELAEAEEALGQLRSAGESDLDLRLFASARVEPLIHALAEARADASIGPAYSSIASAQLLRGAPMRFPYGSSCAWERPA